MFAQLREHYRRHGIGALEFRCRHAQSCRAAGGRFTEARECFVGSEYERHTLPRVLFVSLDPGSGEPEPSRRTLEFARRSTETADVDALDRGKHWYITHELCWVLLRQFKPDLSVTTVAPYFAHVNSARCSQNNPGRREAASILFANCREYLAEEVRILQPDVLVSQGGHAHRGVESAFRTIRELTSGSCRGSVIKCDSREVLWIRTHHPSGYGQFWTQKRECWASFATMAGTFVTLGSSATPSSQGPVHMLGGGQRPPLVSTPGEALLSCGPRLRTFSQPRSIEELVAMAREVDSPESFAAVSERLRDVPAGSRQHVGRFSGMRVQQFQNWQLDVNARYRLTDAQLLAVMRAEFPLAKGAVFTSTLETGLKIMSAIRAHYNRDGHNGPSPSSRGLPPSVSYGRF